MIDTAAKVALVHMPFAAVNAPAVGISLLRAALTQRGISCDVHYLNIPFAKRIGQEIYEWIGIWHLFGEWFFTQELYGKDWVKEHSIFEYRDSSFDLIDQPDYFKRVREVREECSDFMEWCLSTVPWSRYEIIGFSLTGEQNIASLALIKRIKSTWPDKVIVIGGPACEDEMGLELHQRFPLVDIACRGEADLVFPELVARWLNGSALDSIPGLILREDNGDSKAVGNNASSITNLDALPFPDYDDYFIQLEECSLDPGEDLILPFEGSRGCWYGEKHHCTFCGLPGREIAFRSKSPARLMEELAYLTERYGVNRLLATDLILDMKYLKTLLPDLAAREMNWSINCEVKSNLTKAQLTLMKQAGFDSIQPGIESLSSNILKLTNKGCTALQNIQVLKWAQELNLEVVWNIITGFPGEDENEYRIMAAMIPSLFHLQPPQAIGAGRSVILYRFSPYHVDPDRWGITNVRAPAYYSTVYPFPEASLRRLANIFKFDYSDGRDPTAYTESLRLEIEKWRQDYCPGGLTSISSGDSLAIYDRRLTAIHKTYELNGYETAVYQFCDEARTIQSIQKYVADLDSEISIRGLTALVDNWVANRIMISENDMYLSLAVPVDDSLDKISQSDIIKRAFFEALLSQQRQAD